VATQIRSTEAIGGSYPADIVPALAGLLDDLAEAGVRYCSWKSNEHLAEGLAGRTDLDLLVDRADATAFDEVMQRHDLKRLTPAPRATYPGMAHWVGIDRPTARLFHLHLHYQLVLGEQDVKNHRLPLERAFLDSVRPSDGVPVPSPELELAVLCVRALLKYRARDVIKDVLKIRTPGIKPEIATELDWLLARTKPADVIAALRPHRDVIPVDVVDGFLITYASDPRDGRTLLRLRGQVRRALGSIQRQSRLRASVAYVRGLWLRRRRVKRPYEGRMTPATGGVTIALIGADGAGKSTVTKDLTKWLAWKLSVRTFYLGSKSPSRSSRWWYMTFRSLRKTSRALGERSFLGRIVASWRDEALAEHFIQIGRDRTRRYREGLRDAQAGRVVVFDRFPLARLSDDPGLRVLDGPRIRRAVPDTTDRTALRLAEEEERMYTDFRLPDRIVVLQVSPAVAESRKPDHVPEVLAAKTAATVRLADLAGSELGPGGVIRIDADRPLEEVLLEVRRRIWDVL
jgi:thymidylate kinase